MRIGYKGNHKGSTAKARGKNAAHALFNTFLALVLVLGLAPSISFAREMTHVEAGASNASAETTADDNKSDKDDKDTKDKKDDKSDKDDSDTSENVTPADDESNKGADDTETDDGSKTDDGDKTDDSATDTTSDDESAVPEEGKADESTAVEGADGTGSDVSDTSGTTDVSEGSDASTDSDDVSGDDGQGSSATSSDEAVEAGEEEVIETVEDSDDEGAEPEEEVEVEEQDPVDVSVDEEDEALAQDEAETDVVDEDVDVTPGVTEDDLAEDEETLDMDDLSSDLVVKKVQKAAVAKKSAAKLRTAEALEDSIKITLDSSSASVPKNVVGDVEYYNTKDQVNKYLTFKVEFTDSDYDASTSCSTEVTIKNDTMNDPAAKTETIHVDQDAGDPSKYSGTFKVEADDALIPTTVRVTETDKNGKESSKTYENKVVIDERAPSGVSVTWEAVSVDGSVIGKSSSDTALDYVIGGSVGAVSAIATITVKDYNLSYPSSPIDGDGTTTTKIEAGGTNVTAESVSGWTKTKAATGSDSAEYTCKVKFSTDSGATLGKDSTFQPELKITPVDYSGNAASTETKTCTMKIADVDNASPMIAVKKGGSDIVWDAENKAYFDTGESALIEVSGETHGKAGALSASVSGGALNKQALSFSGTYEIYPRTSTITFNKDSGSADNTLFIRDSGSYTLTVEDEDLLGNSATLNNKTLVYDPDDPTIQVEYGDKDGGEFTTLKEASNTTTATNSDPVLFKEDQTVKVTLADAAKLDPSNSEVKFKKSTESDYTSAEINAETGVATLDLTAGGEAGDGATYEVAVTAKDALGHTATYTANFEVYTFVPKIDVTWTENSPTEGVDGSEINEEGKFYNSRTATVTVTDRRFDKNEATEGLVATNGEIAKTGDEVWVESPANTYTATVKYEKNAKNCALAMSYKTSSGTPAIAADSGKITVSAEGAYTSETFHIVNKPIIDVQFSEAAPALKGEEGSQKPYYLLDADEKLTVTVTVLDPIFDDHKTNINFAGVTETCEPSGAVSNPEWADGGALKHTCTVTYSEDCDVSAFVIAGLNDFVGSGSQDLWTVGGGKTSLADGKYAWSWTESETTYTEFDVDGQAPKLLSIAYDTTNLVKAAESEGAVSYFNGSTSADVTISEKHLGATGEDVSISLTKNGDEVSPLGYTYAAGKSDDTPYRYTNAWNGIKMDADAEGNSEIAYKLTVQGTDLAGKTLAMVEGSKDASILDSDGTFTSNVVVDTLAPRLEVTYDKGYKCNTDGIYRFNGTVTATITVTDMSLGDGSTIEVKDKIGNAVVNTDTKPLKRIPEEEHQYTATIAISQENAEHTLEITGKDLAGNALETYTQVIYLDQDEPALKVGMNPSATTAITSGKTPTYYYNEPVTLTGSVDDGSTGHLENGAVTATVKGPSQTFTQKGPAVHGSSYNDVFGPDGFVIGKASEASVDGKYAVSVEGKDAAGNSFKAAAGSDNRASDSRALVNGVFNANIVYDTTRPTVKVSYVEKGSTSANDLAYTDRKTSGKAVTVTAEFTEELSWDKDKIEIRYAVGDAAEQAAKNVTWNGKKATFDLAAESGKHVVYSIRIVGCDLAGNNLAGDPSKPNADADYTATLIVDQEKPTLVVKFEKANSSTVENVKNRNTTNERRYYGGNVTAVITVNEPTFSAEKILVNGAQTKDSDWTHDGNVHTYKVTYSTEAEAKLRVSGTDGVGNVIVSGSVGTTLVSAKGEYVSTVIVDKTAPTVKVTYGTSDKASESTGTLANGKKKQSGADLYVFVTVTDKLSFNESLMSGDFKFSIAPSGNIVKSGSKVWTDNKDGSYTAKLQFKAGADQDKAYNVAVTGKDLAGNELQPYDGLFDIDKRAPRMTVSFNKTPGDIIDASTADETRFYNADKTPITFTVKLVESSNELNLNKITFTDDNGKKAKKVEFGKPTFNGSEYIYTGKITFDTPSRDVIHTITVSGTDAVNNKIVSADESNKSPYVKEGSSVGTYRSKVYLDVTQPVVKVTWDNTTAKNGKYFKKDRTAIVEVIETNFRPDRVTVMQDSKTDLNSGEWELNDKRDTWTSGSGDSLKTWKRSDGDVWMFSEMPYYTEKNTTQELVITATDRAQNALSDSPIDNARPVDDQAPTCSDGKYTSAGFIIDETNPVINVSLNKPVKDTLKNVNYFNNTVVATVVVTERHFGTDNADFVTEVTPTGGSESAAWKSTGSNLWQYKVEYGENPDASKPNGLDVTVYDYAGNKATYTYGPTNSKSKTVANGKELPKGSTGFLVDMTAPTVEPLTGADIPTENYSGKYEDKEGARIFLNKSTRMRIRLNDNIGLYTASLGDENTAYRVENNVRPGSSSHDITVALRDGSEFTQDILLTCEDVAKNVRVWSISPTGEVKDVTGSSDENTPLYGAESNLYPQSAIQDTVAPVLTFSGVKADEYYNSTQTTRLDVDELNFRYLNRYDPDQVVMTIDKQAGEASLAASSRSITVSEFTAVDEKGGKYQHTDTFSEDGHYTVRAQVTDPAKNVSNQVTVENFTIDQTAPKIEVTWDNNDVRNGNYYKAGRTATVVVTEHNFDASLLTITTSGSIGGWSTNGDTHTCTISCTSDGRYSLQITGADKAGNALPAYNEPEFVVDMIAPTITFNEVAAETAYNDNIAPVILYEDEANFNSGAMEYTLTGAKYGQQAMAASQGSSGNSGTVTYADFSREVESDDIWTIDAHVADMAGNEAENSITFSVNRFGSNFIVEDAEDYANGYLDEAREIRVREINVSGVESENHGVTVTHGLKTENLEKQSSGSSTGYYIDEGSESSGWSSYTYHIGADNFADDGNYHVAVSSEDVATNLNNSANYYSPTEHKTADAEVSFILDTVAPIIDSISVMPGGTYDAGTSNVTFNVIDNIGCDDVQVTLDGEKLPESDVALDASGLCMVNVPAVSFKARDMEIVATDRAGHTAEDAVLGFHMTTNPLELHLPLVIGGVVVIAAAAAAGVFFVRRRRGL